MKPTSVRSYNGNHFLTERQIKTDLHLVKF